VNDSEIDRIFKESQERLQKATKKAIDDAFQPLLVGLFSFSVFCFVLFVICWFLGRR
jgi:hypothetical protein